MHAGRMTGRVGRDAGNDGLAIRSVTVRRAGRAILRDVNLSCHAGTVTVVRGANGAGKSTLLGVALGAISPSRGQVVRASSASYLPEVFRPPSGFTVGAYLRWVAAERGVPRNVRKSTVDDYAAEAGMNPSQRLGALSKGNVQRVGLLGALLAAPALVVLDEPFSGVDAAGAELAGALVDNARQQGSTVLIAHHGGDGPLLVDQRVTLERGMLRPQQSARLLVVTVTGVWPLQLTTGLKVLDAGPDGARVEVEDDRLSAFARQVIGAGGSITAVEVSQS